MEYLTLMINLCLQDTFPQFAPNKVWWCQYLRLQLELTCHGAHDLRYFTACTVKHCVKLRVDSRYRRQHSTAIVSGIVPITELCEQVADLRIQTLFYEPQANCSIPGMRAPDTQLLCSQKFLQIHLVPLCLAYLVLWHLAMSFCEICMV